jgi:hypothetical protein
MRVFHPPTRHGGVRHEGDGQLRRDQGSCEAWRDASTVKRKKLQQINRPGPALQALRKKRPISRLSC